MAESEMFDSAARSAGDLAGVFEYEDESGYFYLYETGGSEGQKVAGAIRIVTGQPDFESEDIEISWDVSEGKVALLIRGQIWAVFDAETGAKYGGDYRANAQADIPEEITSKFK